MIEEKDKKLIASLSGTCLAYFINICEDQGIDIIDAIPHMPHLRALIGTQIPLEVRSYPPFPLFIYNGSQVKYSPSLNDLREMKEEEIFEKFLKEVIKDSAMDFSSKIKEYNYPDLVFSSRKHPFEPFLGSSSFDDETKFSSSLMHGVTLGVHGHIKYYFVFQFQCYFFERWRQNKCEILGKTYRIVNKITSQDLEVTL
jgi:hypothetical protein